MQHLATQRERERRAERGTARGVTHVLGVVLLALAVLMMLVGVVMGVRHAWRIHEALAQPTFRDYTAGMWKALIGVGSGLFVGVIGAALVVAAPGKGGRARSKRS